METERYIVAKEGYTTAYGVGYNVGSIQLPEGPLDVTLGPPPDEDAIMGAASDFRRHANGEVSCLIEWEDDMPSEILEGLGHDRWLMVAGDKHRAWFDENGKTIEWLHIGHIFIANGHEDPWARPA